MTLFALGLSYKGELLLAFEFAAFSGRFKFFVSSSDHHFVTSSQASDGGVVPSSGRVLQPIPRSHGVHDVGIFKA
jgi:hypothetical protein